MYSKWVNDLRQSYRRLAQGGVSELGPGMTVVR
jgi:hypothetical protein